MNKMEFSRIRKKLKKTQRQLAIQLGSSIKAVHSYEQGWRNIPPHVERQMLYLINCSTKQPHNRKPCWELNDCPAEWKDNCFAWELQEGILCWFVNGACCHGRPVKNWEEKMSLCRQCKVMKALVTA